MCQCGWFEPAAAGVLRCCDCGAPHKPLADTTATAGPVDDHEEKAG